MSLLTHQEQKALEEEREELNNEKQKRRLERERRNYYGRPPISFEIFKKSPKEKEQLKKHKEQFKKAMLEKDPEYTQKSDKTYYGMKIKMAGSI